MTLARILKLADIMLQNNESLEQLCAHFDSFIIKHSHMTPENDGSSPNPLKRNMDYAKYENSPYFGSVSEFMKKFPGGIKEWLEWRRDTQKNRNEMYNVKKASIEFEDQTEQYTPTTEDFEEAERKADPSKRKQSADLVLKIVQDLIDSGEITPEEVNDFIKKNYGMTVKSHFVPEKGDDVEKFKDEPHIFSGDMGKYKDIKEFIKKYHKHMDRKENDAADAALNAAKDFVEYYKLLLKGKNKRKVKK